MAPSECSSAKERTTSSSPGNKDKTVTTIPEKLQGNRGNAGQIVPDTFQSTSAWTDLQRHQPQTKTDDKSRTSKQNHQPTSPGKDDDSGVELKTPPKKATFSTAAGSGKTPSTKPHTTSTTTTTTTTTSRTIHTNPNAHVSQRPPLPPANTSPASQSEALRNAQRPAQPQRSATTGTVPLLEQLSVPQIDRNLEILIREGPKPGTKFDSNPGFVYIFRARPQGCRTRLLKIGRTVENPTSRRKSIKKACNHPEISEHEPAVRRRVEFHGLLEKLVHKELANFRFDFQCSCKTQHREYFHVDDGVALEVFERWSAFCDKRPWDAAGRLLPDWEQRLAHRAVLDGGSGRDELARRWRVFAQPLPVERVGTDFVRMWRLVFPNRWAIVAFAELLTMAYVSPMSSWTVRWIKVVVLLSVMELFVMDGMYTTEVVSRLMGGGLQGFFVSARSDAEVDGTPLKKAVSSIDGVDDGANPADEEMEIPSRDDVRCGEDMNCRKSSEDHGNSENDVTDDESTRVDAMEMDEVGSDDTDVEECPSPCPKPRNTSGRRKVSNPDAKKRPGERVKAVVIDLTHFDSD